MSKSGHFDLFSHKKLMQNIYQNMSFIVSNSLQYNMFCLCLKVLFKKRIYEKISGGGSI